MPIMLDFESRSRADLKKVGGRNYFEHASTEVLCAVLFDTDSGEIEIWERGQPRPAMLRFERSAFKALGAHNARGFDRFAAERLGWPEIEIDTSELARAAGLPGALDQLATRWLGLAKDKAASKFTKGLSSVRRPAKGPGAISAPDWKLLDKQEQRERGALPACGPVEMARVVEYCLSDVEIMAHGWPVLETWQGIEPDVQRVDRAINDRGVRFDSQLARRLLEEDELNSERVCEATARACGLSAARVREIANSNEQFPAFTGLPNAQAPVIAEALLGGDISFMARAMCAARDALASIARGKLTAGLNHVSPDGRLRDSLKYIGGHTWRWSHTGMQLGNMARPDKQFEEWKAPEINALVDHVLSGGHITAEQIDLLVRACLFAREGHTLVTEDFSGVEARALAWAAGDEEEMAIHADGKLDPYKVAASQIFGVRYEDVTKAQRQAGKVAVLACGYGGGPNAIARFAKSLGVDLSAAGVDEQTIVDGWRGSHRKIVGFWYACERALGAAIEGRESSVSCFRFVPAGGDVAVLMPNGRPLVYNEAKLSRGERGRPVITYMGRESYGGFPEKLYGGKIVENLIQSMCRELLAEALVAAEDCGLAPVLHVHDEVCAEVPASDADDGAEALHCIMTTVPEWCPGFPLGAAGHVGKRYRK